MRKSLKKTVSLFLAGLLFLVQTQAYAYAFFPKMNDKAPDLDAAVFQLDESVLDAAMTEVNRLDAFLNDHAGFTYDDVMKAAPQLLAGYSDMEGLLDGNGPLGIPSFIWGCVLGWVGILIVYLMTEDTEETKKALYGCIASTVVWLVVYFVVLGSAAAAAHNAAVAADAY